jgi:hypothetical protein
MKLRGGRGVTTAFVAILNITTLHDQVLTAEYYTRILCCFRNSACNVWSRWGTSCRTSDHFLVRSWNITTDKDFQNKQTNKLHYIIQSQLTHSHITNILPRSVRFNNQLPIWVSTTSWRHITRVEVKFCAFSTSALDGNEYGVQHS